MTGYLESANNIGATAYDVWRSHRNPQFAHHFLTQGIPLGHRPWHLESILYLLLNERNKMPAIYAQKLQNLARGRQTPSGLVGKSKPELILNRGGKLFQHSGAWGSCPHLLMGSVFLKRIQFSLLASR